MGKCGEEEEQHHGIDLGKNGKMKFYFFEFLMHSRCNSDFDAFQHSVRTLCPATGAQNIGMVPSRGTRGPCTKCVQLTSVHVQLGVHNVLCKWRGGGGGLPPPRQSSFQFTAQMQRLTY